MTRLKFDQSAYETLAGCVGEIERSTNAEIVIVVRAHSGGYTHADVLFGAILAFLGLLFLLFSPFEFAPHWVAIDVVLLFVLGAYLSSKIHLIRRLLTTSKAREKAVRVNAAAMFYEAGIANTSAEMGVLVYLSLLERRLELIADRGVLLAVPAIEWNQQLSELHQAGRRPEVSTILKALNDLGILLAKRLPPTGENPNELPNMPGCELK